GGGRGRGRGPRWGHVHPLRRRTRARTPCRPRPSPRPRRPRHPHRPHRTRAAARGARARPRPRPPLPPRLRRVRHARSGGSRAPGGVPVAGGAGAAGARRGDGARRGGAVGGGGGGGARRGRARAGAGPGGGTRDGRGRAAARAGAVPVGPQGRAHGRALPARPGPRLRGRPRYDGSRAGAGRAVRRCPPHPRRPMNLRYVPPVSSPPAASGFGDRYLLMLGGVLLGYALVSRTFAYLGVPPLFVGEVVLALGLVALLGVTSLRWMGGRPAFWLLGALLALVAARTLPYVGRYGRDAPRDAMQAGYGLFAFVVAGLLVARPERLPALLRRYRVFAAVVLALGWGVYLAVKLGGTALPKLPWASNVQVLEMKAGEYLVHLAAITGFLYFGFARRRPVLVALLALSGGLALPSSRGGMAAYGLGVAAAWALRPPTARAGRLAYAFVALLAVGV